jgi:hypothetical protein
MHLERQASNLVVRAGSHGGELGSINEALQSSVVLPEDFQESLDWLHDTVTQASRAITECFVIQGRYEVVLHPRPASPIITEPLSADLYSGLVVCY